MHVSHDYLIFHVPLVSENQIGLRNSSHYSFVSQLTLAKQIILILFYMKIF